MKKLKYIYFIGNILVLLFIILSIIATCISLKYEAEYDIYLSNIFNNQITLLKIWALYVLLNTIIFIVLLRRKRI